ncbi:hypothetical protein GGG16DRAFT_114981 [Schizophyllum commune]
MRLNTSLVVLATLTSFATAQSVSPGCGDTCIAEECAPESPQDCLCPTEEWNLPAIVSCLPRRCKTEWEVEAATAAIRDYMRKCWD